MKQSLVVASLLLSAAACGSDKSPPPPAAAGGTGAFGIVTVGGRQKMYLPLTELAPNGNGVVAVVDVGVPGHGTAGAPALVTDIDLGSPDVATATGGDASVVIAVSTNNRNLWFIDPSADKVVGKLTLDTSYQASSFSGGGGFVTGVAIDSTNRRAILSVWNGFAIVDLDQRKVTQNIIAAPSENFGFDSMRQRIIAPFYNCLAGTTGTPPPCDSYKGLDGSPMRDGLNVIDLGDGTVYTYQDPMAQNPAAPAGTEPDSAAADPSSGIAIVPSEGDGWQNVIDLSQAHFDAAQKVVTAPHQYIQNQGLTGVAIEPSQHWGFWEEEFSSQIGLADVVAASQGKANYLPADMPTLPDSSGWSNLGDPHGIAVSTALADGRSLGFVVDSGRKWVARVDLGKMSTLPHASALGMTGAELAPAVTFLDARSKP
ncbi:MAG TPA: hypothetical protein VKN99_01125 [Polyangia bacterium]|nr:hypothetical protein [Polyangia bacterium]